MSSLNHQPPRTESLDLDAVRARLAQSGQQQFWRGLEQFAASPEFEEYMHREFPAGASEWIDPVGRRNFLKLMAASLALAGLTGCTDQPLEPILPYVRAVEELVPGKPLFFATTMPWSGYGIGLVVESHMGRPTKIEGNPLHPASLGGTNVFAQASILSLYDPDRSQTIMHRGGVSTWARFITALSAELPRLRNQGGAGLAILTETVTSPTLGAQIRSLLEDLPKAKWYQYDPYSRDNVRIGSRLAFGEFVDTIYSFDQADIVLSLDSDFLFQLPGSIRYARDFIHRRRLALSEPTMNRLYVVEPSPSITGAMADHRLPMPASQVERFARAVARGLGAEVSAEESAQSGDFPPAFVRAVVDDLRANVGRSLVIAGERQPPIVHALAHAMNRALKNTGATVLHLRPVEDNPVIQGELLRELVDDMQSGRTEMLLMLGGNPVLTAPGTSEFVAAFEKVPFRVHLSDYFDETSFLSHWHIPAAHYLESWSDLRAYNGMPSIIQPLIAPLYLGRTAHQVIAAFRGETDPSVYEIVQGYWQSQWGDDFGTKWQRALHDGVIPDFEVETLQPDWTFVDEPSLPPNGPPTEGAVEVVFQLDPTVWDGSFANNAWLQELPKPLTKLSWDNAAYVSPSTAQNLNLRNEDIVELSVGDQTVQAPIWIMPGHSDGTVGLSLGYGRVRAGRIGSGIGYNAYPILPGVGPWFLKDVALRKTGEQYELVTTQNHDFMEGRDLVRAGTLVEYLRNPEMFKTLEHGQEAIPSLYPEYVYEGNAWGMVIDQTACIGCNACVIACQAENNVPIVGKPEVGRGREMYWLRIDRYYYGDDLDNPATYFQPMLCMHCEKAPCEVVCPVAATVHDSEGLNEMIYNRCVGTRYCSNNCPYKVRRFNFLDYTEGDPPSLKLMRNPDVTIRSRGVMEKCTYCVQRINSARIEAKKENRPIRDGEIATACQAACPTQAIIFGNINDPDAAVRKLKELPLNYGLLAELNTQPRTSYLARLYNPHPELATPVHLEGPHQKQKAHGTEEAET